MSQQESEEEQVKFQDVAACFSEEEWKSLHEWQKDFYKIVMKEIHQALILLGYRILNPDTLLRIYKGNAAYTQDCKDVDRTILEDPIVPSHTAVNPDILLRMSHREAPIYRNEQGSYEMGGSHRSTARFPVVTAAFSLATEVETALHSRAHLDSQRRESNHCTSSNAVIPRDIYVSREREVEMDSTEQDDCVIIESSDDSSDDGPTEFQSKFRETMECDETSSRTSSLAVRNSTTQSAHRGQNPATKIWFGRRQEKEVESTADPRGFSDVGHVSVHQGRAKIIISQKRKNCESDAGTRPVLNGHLPPSHECSVCNRCFSMRCELLKHMASHSRERAYACTQCDRRFFQKFQLSQHYRTHTGERPYVCPCCDKKFIRKDHLDGHMRLHTGERPYKCTQCERDFCWKSNLNQHIRIHHQPRDDI